MPAERKIVRGMIAPPTRVRHALARVIFYARLLVASALLPIPSPLAADGVERAIDVEKRRPNPPLPGAGHPGDPALMCRFDFEGPVLYHPGKRIKDHSVVLEGGVFHVFYIIEDDRAFGHAVSTDLRHWTILEPVLEAGPEDWDSRDIWAPCVVPFEIYDGYYLMYYTGVNANSAQRTGLAYCTGDLGEWHKASAGMMEPFACDTSWCLWDESGQSHFRDPHMFSDGEGSHWIIQTARTRDGYGAIAAAADTGLFDWSDAGPLYVHGNWHLLESSMILYRGGRYHLFFTEETVGGISHMSSGELMSGWNAYTRAIIDPGHACDITPSGGSDILSRHTAYLAPSGDMIHSIRFDTLSWDQEPPEVSLEPSLGNGWTAIRGTAFDHQPVFGNPFLFRGDRSTDPGFEGNWWIGTAESFNGPILGGSPGEMQGDSPTGAIRSKTFTVTGRAMSLLVGGGAYPDSCYVALVRASDGVILRKEIGRGVEEMDRRVWDLEPFAGEEVYLEIVDDCSSAMGHINVDSIEESPFPAAVVEDGECRAPASGGEGEPGAPSGAAGRATGGPLPPLLVRSSPNPFNPATKVSFEGERGREYSVEIFTVAGRRIFTAAVRPQSSGRCEVEWNGRTSSGSPVSSGVYVAAVAGGGRILGVCKLILLR